MLEHAIIASGLRREEPLTKRDPMLTVRTPCPSSVYTISYAANGAASVQGHEQFFNLPDGVNGKNRPFYLPNAAVRSGDMCLVEFGQTAEEGSCGSCHVFGFTAASGECLTDPLHDYYCHPSAVVLSLYGTALLCGSRKSSWKRYPFSTQSAV